MVERGVRALLIVVVAAGVALWPTAATAATATGRVTLSASIDGHDVRRADTNRPIKLRGDRPAEVRLRVRNDDTTELFVRSVRINGRVVGLSFFSYETRVDMRVPPGGTDERAYALDLVDLADQATGLLPARLALLDERREEIAVERFATDVDGSLRSVYGAFGLLVAAITALLLASALFRLAAHRMAPNRWKRGVRFGTAGLGIGLTLTFSLSAIRVLLPSPTRSLTLVVLSGVILFAFGYFTPTPEGAVPYVDDISNDVRAYRPTPSRSRGGGPFRGRSTIRSLLRRTGR